MIKSIILILWRVVIFFGLLALPLFFLKDAPTGFEILKVKLMLVWVVIFSLLTLIKVLIFHNLEEIKKIHFLVMVWFGVVFLSSVFGEDFRKSVFGNYFRWDGLVTIYALLGLFFCLSLNKKQEWKLFALWGVALSNIFSSIWAIMQMVLKTENGFFGQGAGFGQPVFLAGYLIVSTPLLWLIIDETKNKITRFFLFLLTIVLVFGGLLATKSLVAMVCFPILILGLGLIKGKINWKLVVFLVFLFLFFGVIKYSKELKLGEGLGSGLVYEGRERLFRKSWLAFLQKPVLGWGVANFDKAFDAVDWPIRINNDIYADKAHSNLVEMLVTGGLITLGAYFLFLKQLLMNLYLRMNRGGGFLLLSVLMYLIQSQTNVTSVSEEVLFWVIVALGT